MKHYLIDPTLNWYKANLHCHTTNSDGHFTPEEIKREYQKEGYSIVAYTDHEIIVDNSYLTDDKFLALTSSEYSLSKEGEVRIVHMNLYAKDPHNTFHPACSLNNLHWVKDELKMGVKLDGYERTFSIESINETIKRANEAGFLVQFNHPHWSLNIREDYINLKGLWSLEIYNHLTELETGAEYCPYIYDDMLNSGIKLFATMGDDNHNKDKKTYGSFGGFNYIGAPSLTYDNVIKAMEEGTLYSSMGPVIKSLYVEDNKVYVECSEAYNIIFTGKNRRYRNVCEDNITSAIFELRDTDEFFRITVVDKYNRRAHTHAYYLKDLK